MIYILIPVYNESKNIQNLFLEVKNILPEYNKLFVFSDDGSIDNTVELIKSEFSTISHKVLSDGINRGPGGAFNTGFEWILQNSKSEEDLVITMEADCTSDISLLPKMVAIHQVGFNLVLASVYAQGGGFDGTTLFRKFISSIANLAFRFIFNIKVLTLSSFYRLYSIDLLRKIKENNSSIITETGFICMVEVLVKAIEQEATIIEVPMTLNSKKRAGSSKMKILKTSIEYFKFFLKRGLNKNK
ncbi:MAG: glycosyltransferase [Bacteroidia bacterium]